MVECTCGLGDAEFHLNDCALALRLPFQGWDRGGWTHHEDCWKNHLACALIRATDFIADALDELAAAGVYEEAGNSPLEDFVQHIRDNQ